MLSGDELNRALQARGFRPDEIERAARALSAPDPAGIVPAPTCEQVAAVAAYTTQLMGRLPVRSPLWSLIEQGHSAAHAIFWHELREMGTYSRLGITNPLQVQLGSPIYWQAHAWACWVEAPYWVAWAQAEGLTIRPEAFLWAHPLGDARELRRVRTELCRAWGVTLRNPGVVQLQQAEASYRRKRLNREDMPW